MIFVLLIIGFTLVQAMLLGHIHIFGLATPLFYVYFALLFRRGYSRWLQMVMCFVLGLAVDIFSNTPGMAAFTMTLVGFLQPYVLELFLRKEDPEDLKPGLATLGFTKYFAYAFILVLVYCFVFFSLEAFSCVNVIDWLIGISGSMALTLVVILIVDSVRR